MITKLKKPNTKAMLTSQAVKGIEKILSADRMSFIMMQDKNVVSAFRFLNNTVNIFNSPEAIAKRKKNIENKKKWKANK